MIEKILAFILAAIISAFAGGCASLPANPTKMSPQQLKEFVKDKSDYISCGTASTPWGKGIGVYVAIDKGVAPSTVVTVDGDCKTTITNMTPAPPPK